MSALRQLENEGAPLVRNVSVIRPLGHGLGLKRLAAGFGDNRSNNAGTAKLFNEGSDHVANIARLSGTRQQPFWHYLPEDSGDNAAMPDKPSDFNEAAGDRLRRCREFLKQTQNDFASDLGVSRTVLENWESGDNCPKPEAIERARQIHGITHDWVYGGNPYLLPDDMKKAVSKPRQVQADSQAKRRKGAA